MRMRSRFLLAAALLVGCRLSHQVPIEPGVNFAAHVEHERLVIDRLPDGGAGEVAPRGWLRWPGSASPTLVLTEKNGTVAGLWLTAPATVEVRSGTSTTATSLGSVEPSWEDNAIRLTLHAAAEGPFDTDLFARQTTGGGPPVLSRIAQSVLDVRGAYRAALRDTKGAEAGWLRVKISPYQESPRMYDGVLPVAISPGLAAATAVALGSEIDWIEDHALDVYRGTTGGPLRESIPMGR